MVVMVGEWVGGDACRFRGDGGVGCDVMWCDYDDGVVFCFFFNVFLLALLWLL